MAKPNAKPGMAPNRKPKAQPGGVVRNVAAKPAYRDKQMSYTPKPKSAHVPKPKPTAPDRYKK